MVNLENTCILVRTSEENEMLCKEAEKQGFHWYSKYDCEPLPKQYFPDILKFYNDKSMVHSARIEADDSTFYEASEFLGTKEPKEMTAREFAEWIADVRRCSRRECTECVLYERNTKCNKYLCNIFNWKYNIDELLEIVKSGRITVSTPEEQAIDILENLIENPDRTALNDELVDALKLAVEKMKEVK